ncbi:MAG: hypothetical protein P8Y53_15755 [Pseudolabrys sp.]
MQKLKDIAFAADTAPAASTAASEASQIRISSSLMSSVLGRVMWLMASPL